MKIPVYDTEGREKETLELKKELWEGEPHLPSMHLSLVRQLAGKRHGTASTKRRGEVRGGGKKPWKQKGTGRARHGSIRSPIWEGGGVVFGPKPRSYSFSIPKNVRRLALKSALWTKARENALRCLDRLSLKEVKTRQIEDLLMNLKITGTVLLLIPEKQETIMKSARNIEGVKVMTPATLSLHDLLTRETLLCTKEALKKVEEGILC